MTSTSNKFITVPNCTNRVKLMKFHERF